MRFLVMAVLLLRVGYAESGTFVLHKFAAPIGKETYSIEASGENYTLTSDFLFTDRGTKVPLKTTFTATTRTLDPRSLAMNGRISRLSAIDHSFDVTKPGTVLPRGPWFAVDGYSPVAMQEQMMRWWTRHNKPAEFTAMPVGVPVHIRPAGTLTIDKVKLDGFTVGGLIWGKETLWMNGRDLVALISTDAEYDHFEAVREPFAGHLSEFISEAVRLSLKELEQISASARVPAPKSLAIVGATLIDSTGHAPVSDSAIVIQDGRITAAGPRNQVTIPRGTTLLDARGKFAVPGLWDMHAHYEQVEWGPIYLATGITSVRDCGNEFDFIRTLHDELDRPRNPAVGPHLEFAGIVDGSGPQALGAVVADTPAEGEAWVRRYRDVGARQIKIYSSMKPDVLSAIAAFAHSLGMTVTGHVPRGMTAIEGIEAGMDQINHIQYAVAIFAPPPRLPDGQPDRTRLAEFDDKSETAKRLLETAQAHRTVWDPTAALYELSGHSRSISEFEPGVEHIAPQLRAGLDSPIATGDTAVRADQSRQVRMSVLRTMHAAGIPIVAGTDQAVPGYSLHRELEIYVEAGFTPLEALQSATLIAARAAGAGAESGTLEPGKRGDVLILDANPLDDIRNTRRIWRTVAAGAVYQPAPLLESIGFKP